MYINIYEFREANTDQKSCPTSPPIMLAFFLFRNYMSVEWNIYKANDLY